MNDKNTVSKISLSPLWVALVLGSIACILVLASLAGQLAPHFTGRSEPVVFLSVDAEQNLPTFFSVLLILAATLLLTVIATFKKAQRDSYTFYWALLAVGFLCMAIDEATSLHEKLQGPVGRLLGDDRPAIFYFAWLAPGIAFVLIMGLLFLKFLLHLPIETRRHFLTAGAVYLGGAIVMELIGSYYAATYGINSWIFVAASSVEEGFEMGGMIVFIFALLRYMAGSFGEVQFGFSADTGVLSKDSSMPKAVPAQLKVSRDSLRPSRPEVTEKLSGNIREPAATS